MEDPSLKTPLASRDALLLLAQAKSGFHSSAAIEKFLRPQSSDRRSLPAVISRPHTADPSPARQSCSKDRRKDVVHQKPKDPPSLEQRDHTSNEPSNFTRLPFQPLDVTLGLIVRKRNKLIAERASLARLRDKINTSKLEIVALECEGLTTMKPVPAGKDDDVSAIHSPSERKEQASTVVESLRRPSPRKSTKTVHSKHTVRSAGREPLYNHLLQANSPTVDRVFNELLVPFEPVAESTELPAVVEADSATVLPIYTVEVAHRLLAEAIRQQPSPSLVREKRLNVSRMHAKKSSANYSHQALEAQGSEKMFSQKFIGSEPARLKEVRFTSMSPLVLHTSASKVQLQITEARRRDSVRLGCAEEDHGDGAISKLSGLSTDSEEQKKEESVVTKEIETHCSTRVACLLNVSSQHSGIPSLWNSSLIASTLEKAKHPGSSQAQIRAKLNFEDPIFLFPPTEIGRVFWISLMAPAQRPKADDHRSAFEASISITGVAGEVVRSPKDFGPPNELLLRELVSKYRDEDSVKRSVPKSPRQPMKSPRGGPISISLPSPNVDKDKVETPQRCPPKAELPTLTNISFHPMLTQFEGSFKPRRKESDRAAIHLNILPRCRKLTPLILSQLVVPVEHTTVAFSSAQQESTEKSFESLPSEVLEPQRNEELPKATTPVIATVLQVSEAPSIVPVQPIEKIHLSRSDNRKRIAIVVAQTSFADEYLSTVCPPIANQCEFDTKRIGQMFHDMGFKVHFVFDKKGLTKLDLLRKISEIVTAAKTAILAACGFGLTKKCKVGGSTRVEVAELPLHLHQQLVVVVYFAGATYVGPCGVDQQFDQDASRITGVPRRLLGLCQTSALQPAISSFLLLCHDSTISVHREIRERSLTVFDLEEVGSINSFVDHNGVEHELHPQKNIVLVDTQCLTQIKPAAPNVSGIFYVGGRKGVGTELVGFYPYSVPRHQQRFFYLFGFYLARAISGFAARDSKISMNSINAFLAAKLLASGVPCETNSSTLFIGDTALASVHELQYSRSEVKEIKAITQRHLAKVTLCVLPLRNQDPHSSQFSKSVVGALMDVVFTKGHRQRLCVEAENSFEKSASLENNLTVEQRHLTAPTIDGSRLAKCFSPYVKLLTSPSRLIHSTISINPSTVRLLLRSSQPEKLVGTGVSRTAHERNVNPVIKKLISGEMQLGNFTSSQRKTSPTVSKFTQCEPGIASYRVAALGIDPTGCVSFPTALAGEKFLSLFQNQNATRAAKQIKKEAKEKGVKFGEYITMQRRLREISRGDSSVLSAAANVGNFVDFFDSTLLLDHVQVTGISVLCTMSLKTTEYFAFKIERAIRCGLLASSGVWVSLVRSDPIHHDAIANSMLRTNNPEQLKHIVLPKVEYRTVCESEILADYFATKIQSVYRSFRSQRSLAKFLPLFRAEFQSRADLLLGELQNRQNLAENSLGSHRDAYCVIEFKARGYIIGVEKDYRIDLYDRYISSFEKLSLRHFKFIRECLFEQESLIRLELKQRLLRIFLGIETLVHFRKVTKVTKDEQRQRSLIAFEQDKEHRSLSSSWMRWY